MTVGSQICDERLSSGIIDLLPDDYLNYEVFSTIISLLPDFEETMIYCKFFDAWNVCNESLFPVMTEEGLCYSFNAMNINELSTDE